MELVIDARCQTGESPVWDAAAGRLVFVDVPAGRVHGWIRGADAPVVLAALDRPVGAVVPRAGGGFVLAAADGLVALTSTDVTTPLLALEADVADRRANDAVAGPGGHLYVGTTTYHHDAPVGFLYRVDPDATVHEVASGLTLANGIAFTPTGTRAYFTDSVTRRVDVFDHDPTTGALTGRRPFAETGPDGYPDGLTVDAEGGLWVALWSAGRLHRYDERGALDAVVEVPVAGVTNAAFGGPDLDELYVTTTAGPEPGAGGVFAYSPGVAGIVSSVFTG